MTSKTSKRTKDTGVKTTKMSQGWGMMSNNTRSHFKGAHSGFSGNDVFYEGRAANTGPSVYSMASSTLRQNNRKIQKQQKFAKKTHDYTNIHHYKNQSALKAHHHQPSAHFSDHSRQLSRPSLSHMQMTMPTQNMTRYDLMKPMPSQDDMPPALGDDWIGQPYEYG